MPVQDQIDALFTTLRQTLAEINALRERATQIGAGLAAVSQDYAARLQGLNSTAAELRQQISALRAQLRPTPPPPPPTLPPLVDPSPRLPAANAAAPGLTHTQADPRDKRKRDLADYLEGTVGLDDHENVMQLINACVVDDLQDIGHMLERLAWSEVWQQRAPHETLEDQLERLQTWQRGLSERLAFWQGKVRQLEQEPSYDLWRDSQSHGSAQWAAYLDDLVARQQGVNQQLQLEAQVLRQQVQARQADEVSHD